MDHPWFHLPDAAERIAALEPSDEPCTELNERDGRSPALARLCRVPPLSKGRERYLFCRMNFEKYRASLAVSHGDTTASRGHLETATRLRNEVVEANLRLAVSVATEFADPRRTVEELVAGATLPLIRAVELFDVARGLCFSTYASHALRNHYRRERERDERRRRRHVCGDRRLGEVPDERVHPAVQERQTAQRRVLATELLEELSPREREVVVARFGLDDAGPVRTFHEIAERVGLSKERVRVLVHRALEKMREAAETGSGSVSRGT